MSKQPFPNKLLLGCACLALAGCTPIGSLMSPYSERFSCKNDDHGQCVHPERAYEDAVAGAAPRSDPAVTNDHARSRPAGNGPGKQKAAADRATAYGAYKASLYRELQGLIDAPETPMLKAPRTIRTLILPYADRRRPDRLYMPRYVYSILDRPEWVVGSALIDPPGTAPSAPILGQVREPAAPVPDAAPVQGLGSSQVQP